MEVVVLASELGMAGAVEGSEADLEDSEADLEGSETDLEGSVIELDEAPEAGWEDGPATG